MNTPPRNHVPQVEPRYIGKLPGVLGDSAAQFEWLIRETEAFSALVRVESVASSNALKAAMGHNVRVTRQPMPLLNTMINAAESRKAEL
jgi:hypothetical protein